MVRDSRATAKRSGEGGCGGGKEEDRDRAEHGDRDKSEEFGKRRIGERKRGVVRARLNKIHSTALVF